MKTLFAFLFFLFLSTSIFAQSNANATANISASLKHGLSITNIGGDIDFGEIVLTGLTQNPSITPDAGTSFLVAGQPNADVTVTFADVTLDNDAWVIANGGTNGTMTFTADMEHTGASSTYAGASAVTSGVDYTLVNNTGTGNLYLWLGGTLGIGATQANGDYTGTFTVTVAYP